MRQSFSFSDVPGKFATFFYQWVFQKEITEKARDFFKSLFPVAIGSVIAMLFSFAFNIFGGRVLGPDEYGKFTLVQSIAMFLYLPMLLGCHTAIIKYTSEDENKERQSKIISTGYTFIAFLTIIFIIIFISYSSQLSNVFHTSKELFLLSVFFAWLFTLYTVTTNTLRGLHKMKTYAVFQPIYSAILFITFSIFWVTNSLSFKSLIFSMYLSYGIISIAILIFFLRKHLKFKIDKSIANPLIKYSLFAAIGGFSFAFYTNIDKILINKYMTVADVGIYRAYCLASINVAGILFNTFNIVFFPAASKYKNKKELLKKINTLIPYLISLGVPFILLCEFVILKIYGGKYPLNIGLILIFSITSILTVWYSLYDWIFCSEGINGVKIVNCSTIIIAILSIILNIYLIPKFGLYGAISATAVSFSIGIGYLTIHKREII